MPTRSPIIAFLVASSFELLDLTGPASVFAYVTVRDRPYYSFRILSTTSGETVKSMGGIFIADTCTFSDYAGPIDTLIVVGGLGSVEHQASDVLELLRKRASRLRRITTVVTDAFPPHASVFLCGRRVGTDRRIVDCFVIPSKKT